MPRLEPARPPHPPEVAALLDSLRLGLPEPITLFRTLAHSPRVLARIRAGGLLDRGPVPLRLREVMILRTTARCRAGYEWGVHVAGFATRAGLSEAQVQATAVGDLSSLEDDDRLVVALADALHDRADVDDALWQALTARFSTEVVLELVALAGFYHLISFTVNALRLEDEAFAPPLPVAQPR